MPGTVNSEHNESDKVAPATRAHRFSLRQRLRHCIPLRFQRILLELEEISSI